MIIGLEFVISEGKEEDGIVVVVVVVIVVDGDDGVFIIIIISLPSNPTPFKIFIIMQDIIISIFIRKEEAYVFEKNAIPLNFIIIYL